MSNDFIRDDTDLTLLERTNFQVVSTDNGKQVDDFVDDVEELGKDKVSIARSPWVRIGVAVGLSSFILGFAYILSTGGNNKQVTTKSPEEANESALTLQLEEPVESPTSAESSNIDDMRSEIALLEQQIALQNIERDPNAANRVGAENSQTKATQTPTRPAARPTESSRGSAPPASRPAPTPVASQPVPSRPITRTVTVPATPVSRPVPTAASTPSFSSSNSRAEPVNPQQAWLIASTAGVFGAMPPMEVQQRPSDVSSESKEAAEPTYELKTANYNESLEEEVEKTSLFASDEPVPGLIYSGPSFIPVGRSATAEVVTPISWLNDRDQFTLQLIDDVLDQSDNVAIPAGSFVVVQPVSVNEGSGLAELAAVGIDIDGEMIPIDYQNIAIRGEGGNPLLAEKYGDVGGDIASNDLEMFAVGALGGIGEILTRPNSQSTTTGVLSSSSSTNYGDRNIFGAILSGGTRNLTERMADRNDQRLDEVRSRDVIYYLPKGTKLQFYVNSEFQL
jgi:Bacterial conjugation TrbI-like protein